MKLRAVVMIFTVLLVLPSSALGGIQRTFENGDSEFIADFSETNHTTVRVRLPPQTLVRHATLRLEASMDDWNRYPVSPTLDVMDDGTVEWAYNGTYYGAMGMQSVLSDGQKKHSFVFVTGGNNTTMKMMLPYDAEVTSAVMRLRGEPYPGGWWNTSWIYRVGVSTTLPRVFTCDLWLDLRGMNITNRDSIVVIDNTFRRVPYQVVSVKQSGDYIDGARVVFSYEPGIGYYIYFGNPEAQPQENLAELNAMDLRTVFTDAEYKDTSASHGVLLSSPQALDVDAEGNIYVADAGAHAVRVFSPNGTLAATIGEPGVPGNDTGHLNSPSGICLDTNGTIYVSDTENSRIMVFAPNLTYLYNISKGAWADITGDDNLSYPKGIAVDDQYIYVADSGHHIVQILYKNGTPVDFLGTGDEDGTDSDHFNVPYDVDVAPNGDIYIADFMNHRVQIFNSKFNYVTTIGQSGTENGSFIYPASVHIVGNRLYVADLGNHRIQVFSGMQYDSQIGTTAIQGDDSQHLNHPSGVAVRDGIVYIADRDNARVMRVVQAAVSLSRWESPYPTGVSIDIGDDHLEEWSCPGTLIDTVTTEDVSIRLNAALGFCTPQEDEYGNQYCMLKFRVGSQTQGVVRLESIKVEYMWSVKVDVTSVLQDAAGGDQELVIPMTLRSEGGVIRISNLSIEYDTPPHQVGSFQTYYIDEDSKNSTLIDLHGMFLDEEDSPADLIYTIGTCTNCSIVNVSIYQNRYISVDALTGKANDNWYGEVVVTVNVTNTRGLRCTSEPILIVVKSVNDPPVFTSEPVLWALENGNYTYQAEAVDADEDTIRYSLDYAPTGMKIDPSTGLVTWTPRDDQVGDWTVRIKASDSHTVNGYSIQEFTLTVENVNDPPAITSEPYLAVNVGETYEYTLEVEDADPGDTFTYALEKAPSGMKISSNGTVTWAPSLSDVGRHDVVIAVSDGNVTVYQNFTVEVVGGAGSVASSPVMLILLVVVIAAVVAAVLALRSRRRKRAEMPAQVQAAEVPPPEPEAPPQPKVCPSCGSQIEEGLDYCVYCGHTLTEGAAQPTEPAPEVAPEPAPQAAPEEAPEAEPVQPEAPPQDEPAPEEPEQTGAPQEEQPAAAEEEAEKSDDRLEELLKKLSE